MSSVVISGDTSGAITLAAPAVAGTNTITLPAATGNVVLDSATQTLTNKTIQGGAITSGTAVASTSGTSIDFTSIPSWAKRITVMFDQVSLNGASEIMIQLGTSGGIQNTGYFGTCGFSGVSNGSFTFSTGFVTFVDLSAVQALSGLASICLLSIATTGTWTYSGNFSQAASYTTNGAGSKTLSGTLDRIRITTVNGTDTFDAGSINILYE